MASYTVVDGELIIRIPAPHSQVLPFYPTYDPDNKSPLAIEDYSRPDNVCGHTQRAFLNYWGIQSFLETGLLGLELGSAGVADLFCLTTDHIATGQAPIYGGHYQGVQLALDATDLSQFGSNSFGCVINNHLVEHLPCKLSVRPALSQEGKYHLACPGTELIDIFDQHWLRIIKPGGYLCMIIPDERPARKVNSSTLYYDQSHQHFFFPEEFKRNIIDQLKTPVEIVKFDTLKNEFSFETVLRKCS